MRIGVVAPLFESVPPSLYGGTERVVANLVEGLIARGHDVTLFASEDSCTSAELVPCAPRALRLDPEQSDFLAPTLFMLGEVYKRAAQFDVIHNHADWFAFPFATSCPTPTVTTAHGRLDLQDIRSRYLRYTDLPLVSISDDQRRYLPEAAWVGTVYNGINPDYYHFRPSPGEYLVFLGRICPEKGPERAIEIAARAGRRLVMAAKVENTTRK